MTKKPFPTRRVSSQVITNPKDLAIPSVEAEPSPTDDVPNKLDSMNPLNKDYPKYTNSKSEVTDETIPEGLNARLTMPSNCLFYDCDEVFARTLLVSDLIEIHRAVTTDNVTILLDALDKLISVDIRSLTVPDFKYFQIWLRVNSYPATKLAYSWTSKYGNENTFAFGPTTISETSLDLTPEQIASYDKLGLTAPRMRDYEVAQSIDWEKEYGDDVVTYKWIHNRAQYLKGTDLKEKAENFRNHPDPELILKIKAFADNLDYGVNEYVTLTDELFVAEDWVKELDRRLGNLQRVIIEAEDPFSSKVAGIISLLSEYTKEKEKVLGGSGPEPEEVFLYMETDHLFAELWS